MLTRQADSIVLFLLQEAEQAVGKSGLFFGLDARQCAVRWGGTAGSGTRTCFKSSSACWRIAALASRVAWMRSRKPATSMAAVAVLGAGEAAKGAAGAVQGGGVEAAHKGSAQRTSSRVGGHGCAHSRRCTGKKWQEKPMRGSGARAKSLSCSFCALAACVQRMAGSGEGGAPVVNFVWTAPNAPRPEHVTPNARPASAQPAPSLQHHTPAHSKVHVNGSLLWDGRLQPLLAVLICAYSYPTGRGMSHQTALLPWPLLPISPT